MTSCPRPGCAGEVVDGNCRACGIAVDATARAEELRRQAAVAAEQLARHGSGGAEEGTGWFRPPDVLTGSDEAAVAGRGAHRKPDSPAPSPEPRPEPRTEVVRPV